MTILEHPEKFNIERAEKVLAHVTTHPEQHHQEWEMDSADKCAQTGCLMGWAAVFNGKPSGESDPEDLQLTYDEFYEIFDEMDNEVAIDKLQRYIDQAKAAQDGKAES